MFALVRFALLAGVWALIPVVTAQVQLGSELLAANGFKEL